MFFTRNGAISRPYIFSVLNKSESVKRPFSGPDLPPIIVLVTAVCTGRFADPVLFWYYIAIMKSTRSDAGQRRVVIDHVEPVVPTIPGERPFSLKRVIGERVHVSADILADGHDLVRAVLRYRPAGRGPWRETPLEAGTNDSWHGSFTVDNIGPWEYSIRAWIDHFRTWCDGLRKKHDAAVATETDLQIGAALVEGAAGRARGTSVKRLNALVAQLGEEALSLDTRVAAALDPNARKLVDSFPDLSCATDLETPVPVRAERELAAFSAWYELFPRSAGAPGRHGTFLDVIDHLPEIARMGFDILYLPPIHPIGVTKRKGRNNRTEAGPEDPGSPWAIGSDLGGHRAIDPELGTETDFLELVDRARSYQIEIALDIAFQCSPDHPWVREHPQWFVHRPDGSIQYAENPPKKYEDIYPINFETLDWMALWEALREVIFHWIERGVQVFRVDNPHTKSFPFWEWAIRTIQEQYPETIFLAEAFTRPKRMYRLAKSGFTQSYTYFTWRNSPEELRQYMTELTREHPRDYFRPNFWPNTPDILHEDLQTGGRAAFIARLVLAATLSSSYGIYGPAYELMEHEPVRPGSEEYLNSEKYEIRSWTRDDPRSIAPIIGKVNAIRRANRALHSNRHLRFHATDNPHLLCYSKSNDAGNNVILVCVNMDYHAKQAGWVEFSPAAVGQDNAPSFTVRDLLTKRTWTWRDHWNYLELDPAELPVHIFVLEQ
jgi:starch synthase (maltosyl-transferring)